MIYAYNLCVPFVICLHAAVRSSDGLKIENFHHAVIFLRAARISSSINTAFCSIRHVLSNDSRRDIETIRASMRRYRTVAKAADLCHAKAALVANILTSTLSYKASYSCHPFMSCAGLRNLQTRCGIQQCAIYVGRQAVEPSVVMKGVRKSSGPRYYAF